MSTTRRITTLAVLTGAAAAVAVIAAIDTTPDDGASGAAAGSDWIVGLLLIGGPLLAAAISRSVASSSLLRPIGGLAAAGCVLVSALHVAIAVDERGAAGMLHGSPAVATAVLLVAAVIRGRDVGREHEPASPVATVAGDPPRSFPDPRGHPPLDVLSPLLAAREHATKALLAWLVVTAVAAVISVPALRLLGWPTVDQRVEGAVVAVDAVALDDGDDGEGELVTFEAETRSGVVRWTYALAESSWDIGERNEVYVDDDGGVHEDQQLGLTGVPLLGPVGFAAFFGAFAARRLWGLVVAWWDVRGGSDEPTLGFAAVIDDPAPRTMRPLVAVWREDPTGEERLSRPDAVYRADDETCEELQSSAAAVVVRRAWIDTGSWPGAKPRWIGFEHGVAVPHRRSVFGARYVHRVTRKTALGDVVDLEHGPPDPHRSGHRVPPRPRRAALVPMVLWRLPMVLVGIIIGRVALASDAAAHLHAVGDALAR